MLYLQLCTTVLHKCTQSDIKSTRMYLVTCEYYLIHCECNIYNKSQGNKQRRMLFCNIVVFFLLSLFKQLWLFYRMPPRCSQGCTASTKTVLGRHQRLLQEQEEEGEVAVARSLSALAWLTNSSRNFELKAQAGTEWLAAPELVGLPPHAEQWWQCQHLDRDMGKATGN